MANISNNISNEIFNETKTLFIEESNKVDFTLDKITNFLNERDIEYTQLNNRTINIGKISEKVIAFYRCEFTNPITIECELAIIINCKWPKLFSNGNIIALSDNIIKNIYTDKEILLIANEYYKIMGKGGVEWAKRGEKLNEKLQIKNISEELAKDFPKTL